MALPSSFAKFSCIALLATASLGAQTIIVDRGLPTANLNNAAGADRSNVAWHYGTPPAGFSGVVVGDEFNVGNPFSGADVHVTGLSLWVMKSAETQFANFDYLNTSSYSLLLGDNSGFLFPTNGTPLTITTETYSNGTSYQASGGSFIDLLRLDFAVDFIASPDSYVFFALGGYDSAGAFVDPYVHASNGPLSGSVQQGSDDFLHLFGAQFSPQDFFEYAGAYNTDGDGWDKSSSLNVIVSATAPTPPDTSAVPEPSTYGMLAGAFLVGIIFIRRRASAVRV
jgi:hypothetical protein